MCRVGDPLPLLLPAPSSLISDFSVRLEPRPPSPCREKPGAHLAAMASDDVHLYIWSAAADAVVRVGSGRAGTVAGQVYGLCRNASSLRVSTGAYHLERTSDLEA